MPISLAKLEGAGCRVQRFPSVVRIWKHSMMTCQQYVITHLLDPRDPPQILPTAKAASNERTPLSSHPSTVVPRGCQTVLMVVDDAFQRQRAPLVIRAHILKRITLWTLSYPGDFFSGREPHTSASLAKRRRTYRNIFCPGRGAGALLRCKIREFLRVHKAFDKIRNASLHLLPGRGSAACQEGSHVTRLQEVLNVMDENQKAFTGRYSCHHP